MENTTENADQGSSKKVECLVKDVDLKAEMEKAKEWAKNNPIPTGKFGDLAAHVCMNNASLTTETSFIAFYSAFWWRIKIASNSP